MAQWTRATLLKRLADEIEVLFDVDPLDRDEEIAAKAMSDLEGYTVRELIEGIEHSIVREAMTRRIR
jgi:hypothetical protein